jgi:hypothetical protein
MGTKVSDTGGSDFSPVPAGLHRAVCVAYIELGTQQGTKYMSTETVWKKKVAIMWETPDEVMEVDGEKKPYTASKFYTMSLSPKASLTADLESWRSRPFTPEELKEFDLDNILGKPCQINVIHKKSDKGKTYANIIGVLPLSKGMMKPEPSIKPWRYCLMEDFRNFPGEMTEGWCKMVLKSREMTDIASLSPTAEPTADDFPDMEEVPGDPNIPF